MGNCLQDLKTYSKKAILFYQPLSIVNNCTYNCIVYRKYTVISILAITHSHTMVNVEYCKISAHIIQEFCLQKYSSKLSTGNTHNSCNIISITNDAAISISDNLGSGALHHIFVNKKCCHF